MNKMLFSIDLEDVRDWVKDGHSYAERVPANTERYLRFLNDHKSKATFFVVGHVARKYPELIRSIRLEGHELACHSDSHLQLDKLNPQTFRADLEKNLEALYKTGATKIFGYRAPTFSLTEKTSWAWGVLNDLKFTYSSSVLPAKNPLYGWPGFGNSFKKVQGGLWELPITLLPFKMMNVPIAGGVYFRVLPYLLLKAGAKKIFHRNDPVLTYFHPYDIDVLQERFMHPDLNNNPFLNSLMYYNRKDVFPRLKNFIEDFSVSLVPYHTFVESLQK